MKKVYLCAIITLAFLLPANLFAYEETRDFDNFSGISYSISGELYIQQGNKYSVKIVGDEEDVKRIITEREGSNLIIKKKDNHRRDNFSDIKVYVTLPNLNALAVAGSGDVFAQGTFHTEDIGVSLAGSGDVHFEDLQSGDLELSIAGSGDIEIKGRSTDDVEISIAGSGDVKVDDFEAQNVEVSIAGSGSAKVYATKNLETSIIGSGSVYYKGSPLINASSIGSGSTRKL